VWLLLIALTVIVAVGVPVCALLLPEGHPMHLSAYALTLIGKIMCYALAALALDLVWGYCGILSLGHGVFFALGGYAMGMYLMRSIGREGVYKSDLPDFMVFLDWKELPWFWHGTEHFAWAMLLVILVPGVLAWLFGFFAFRSRVKGVYLSIITQAMTYAAMLLFFRNETGFGGNNGFTDFKRIAGFAVAAPQTRAALFVLTFLALQLSNLLGGSVIIESIFALPGVGTLTVSAIATKDYTVIQGCVLFFGIVVVLVNLLVDLSYGFIDPRLRRR